MAAAQRPPVRVIVYAWGRAYVDATLGYCLPALLAPGNLPHLARNFRTEFVFLTEERFFGLVRSHPTFRRLQSICPAQLVSLDDLIAPPNAYGMSLTYVLFRGFEDLGADMTGSYMLFLNADFVLADGSYRGLVEKMLAGERLILSPSYCVVSEKVRPMLAAAREDGVIAIPPREMARMVLRNRHCTIRGKTINQRLFSLRYIDQFYWLVDSHTMLGRQLPVSMVAMRPTEHVRELHTYWDYGITAEFCPDVTPCIIGDSDQFLMLELREEATAEDQLRWEWPSAEQIARTLSGFVTKPTMEIGKHDLVLHARDLPPGTDDARRRLGAFVDEVFVRMPVPPPAHLGHPIWIHHYADFHRYRNEYLEARAAGKPVTIDAIADVPAIAAAPDGGGDAEALAPREPAPPEPPLTAAIAAQNLSALDPPWQERRATVVQELGRLSTAVGKLDTPDDTAWIDALTRLTGIVKLMTDRTFNPDKRIDLLPGRAGVNDASMRAVLRMADLNARFAQLQRDVVETSAGLSAALSDLENRDIDDLHRRRHAWAEEFLRRIGELGHQINVVDSDMLADLAVATAAWSADIAARKESIRRLAAANQATVDHVADAINAFLHAKAQQQHDLEHEIEQARERERAQAAERAMLSVEQVVTVPAVVESRPSLLRQAYRAVFGRLPDLRPAHAFYCPMRHVLAFLKDARPDRAGRVLLINNGNTLLDMALAGAANRRVARPRALASGLPLPGLDDGHKFDLCVAELELKEMSSLRAIHDAVQPLMAEGGRMIAFCANWGFEKIPTDEPALIRGVFPICGPAKVRYSGSPASAKAIELMRRFEALAHRAERRVGILGPIVKAAGMVAAMPLTYCAAAIEGRRDAEESPALPDPCTAIAIEILFE